MFKKPFIIAFGSEAEGLSKEFLKNKTVNIRIETSNDVESLKNTIDIDCFAFYTIIE